jgi:predicted LPLAT superfamily acyltransferase
MAWFQIRERGSAWGIWLFYQISRIAGYSLTRHFSHFIVLYFFLFGSQARKNIRTFQKRAVGRTSWLSIYRTFFHFSESIVDRMFILSGRGDRFTNHYHGKELMDTLVDKNQGALMLGSHIGPMEASRLHAETLGYRISVMMYTAISPKLYALLNKIAPDLYASMILVDPKDVSYIFDVKQRIYDGEFIAMLADRPWSSGRTRTVSFLGQPAEFPLGPFEIALTIGCPILLTFIIKTGKYKYDVYLEELTPGAQIDRSDRNQAAAALQDKYVDRIEYYLKRSPEQWYNFSDIWSEKNQ